MVPKVLKRRNIMLKENVFEVIPWPINGFSGVGGAQYGLGIQICL